MTELVTRGATNGNARGSAEGCRRRRAWLMVTFASDVRGLCRCYRCGALLYNPDDALTLRASDPRGFEKAFIDGRVYAVQPLSVDRIIPGCKGGTYRRNNIRPACLPCNSETGGGLRARKAKSA